MAINRPKSGFYIGVTCPGCGGALDLQENFFVLTCAHCGSVLRIIMPEMPPAFLIPSKISRTEVRFHLDYYLKQNHFPLAPSNMEMKALYYPYWKVDAIVLKLRNRVEERHVVYDEASNQEETIQQKKTDINLVPYVTTIAAGVIDDAIPYSIGMRADYIKMIPFAADKLENGFEAVPPIKSWDDIRLVLSQNVAGLGQIAQADFGENKTELFHPIGSIIYFPYFILETALNVKSHRFVMDGVTGRVISDSVNPERAINSNFSAKLLSFGKLGVEFHRCPNCGSDLPAQQSYVYICSNCQRLIQIEAVPRLDSRIFEIKSPEKGRDNLFPFWVFKIPSESAGKVRSFFSGIYGSDRLVIPAFKMRNFDSMYRLSKRISAAYPRTSREPIENFSSYFLPVTVGAAEAAALAEIIIYREAVGRDQERKAASQSFQSDEIALLYAPFHQENYFFVDSVMNAVTFEKGLVS